MSYSKIHYHY